MQFYRDSSKTGRPQLPGQWADVAPHVTAIENMRRAYRTQNRQVDEILAKWGYRAVPGNMDISIKYADTRFLPALPGGSLQPIGSQAPVQSGSGGSFMQKLLGETSPQPTTPAATPMTGSANTFMEKLLAGAR